MGEVNILVYVIVVGFLGLAAAALAFAAEATKVKVSDVSITQLGNCEYPRSPAYKLGYAAALLTLIVQITIISIARCTCCERNNYSNTDSFEPGLINYILSCVGATFAIILLLLSASRQDIMLRPTGFCYTIKPGAFATGGTLALVACILGLCSSYYFLLVRRNSDAELAMHQDGILVANPKFDVHSTFSNPKQPHVE